MVNLLLYLYAYLIGNLVLIQTISNRLKIALANSSPQSCVLLTLLYYRAASIKSYFHDMIGKTIEENTKVQQDSEGGAVNTPNV